MHTGLREGKESRRPCLHRASHTVAFCGRYKGRFQWADSIRVTLEKAEEVKTLSYPYCMVHDYDLGYVFTSCGLLERLPGLCDVSPDEAHPTRSAPSAVYRNNTRSLSQLVGVTVCPAKHFTRDFLACNPLADCFVPRGRVLDYVSTPYAWHVPSRSSCSYRRRFLPPDFLCASGHERVSFSFVCDHIRHCLDNSDEDFCVFPPCPAGFMQCGTSQQCFHRSKACDNNPQCHNQADEELCSIVDIIKLDYHNPFHPHRASDPWGFCKPSEFFCKSKSLCLPVYLICNGLVDCSERVDESQCSEYQCDNHYRCLESRTCLHPKHLCDGTPQCPRWDDELLCQTVDCPISCWCYGLAWICGAGTNSSALESVQLRYLHCSGCGFDVCRLVASRSRDLMLVHLGLPFCRLSAFPASRLLNLHSLDLSFNRLPHLGWLHASSFPRLRQLSVSGNPLRQGFFSVPSYKDFSLGSLMKFDLSRIPIGRLNLTFFEGYPNIKALNLSKCAIEIITRDSNQVLTKAESIDFSGSSISYFPHDIFEGMDALQYVKTDNFILCCSSILPRNVLPKNCLTQFDTTFSCHSLLQNDILRITLWVFAFVALAGNLGSFVSRAFVNRESLRSGFAVFVLHLCLADFLMGLYLAIIGVKDRLSDGVYASEDNAWRKSWLCKTAGFLCLLSSETSAFIICLITVDRLVVIRFPFSRVRFSERSAQYVLAAVWLCGILLSAGPLFPGTARWNFYGQSVICIPLPNRLDEPGYVYNFGVMIVLNFVLFLLIAVGQSVIYVSVQINTMSSHSTGSKSRDLTIAQRLISIAVSDFACWFPICLTGLLSATGTVISKQVSIGMALCALPFNSAVNPFLYTVNTVLERRRREREQILLAKLKVKALKTKLLQIECDKQERRIVC